jgi:hypothetical protein
MGIRSLIIRGASCELCFGELYERLGVLDLGGVPSNFRGKWLAVANTEFAICIAYIGI